MNALRNPSNTPFSNSEPYSGAFTVSKHTITYLGTILPVKNISKFETYGIRKTYKISNNYMIGSGIACLLTLSFWSKLEGILQVFDSIIFIIAGIILFLAIRERTKAQEYGFSIYLNSGSEERFRTKNKDFLKKLMAHIYYILNEEKQSDNVQILYADTVNNTVDIRNYRESTVLENLTGDSHITINTTFK